MGITIFRRFYFCRTVPLKNKGMCCLDVGCLWHIVVDGGLDIGNDQHNANRNHDSVLNNSKKLHFVSLPFKASFARFPPLFFS
jgi:hypothetical protein